MDTIHLEIQSLPLPRAWSDKEVNRGKTLNEGEEGLTQSEK